MLINFLSSLFRKLDNGAHFISKTVSDQSPFYTEMLNSRHDTFCFAWFGELGSTQVRRLNQPSLQSRT